MLSRCAPGAVSRCEALGRAREEIDAINVYPVADGDTGTNLYLTVESAAAGRRGGVRGARGGLRRRAAALADAARAMAHGALIGARGQLRDDPRPAAARHGPGAGRRRRDRSRPTAAGLRLALRHAADSARQAVAHPVEGTVLTVASAAADAAAGAEGDCGRWPGRPTTGPARALAATPGQLAVLERAGVVDAGGRGLVAVLGALVETFTGERAGRWLRVLGPAVVPPRPAVDVSADPVPAERHAACRRRPEDAPTAPRGRVGPPSR